MVWRQIHYYGIDSGQKAIQKPKLTGVDTKLPRRRRESPYTFLNVKFSTAGSHRTYLEQSALLVIALTL